MDNQSEEHNNSISLNAMATAIDFVQASVQHTSYIAGKDSIASEVEKAEIGTIKGYIIFYICTIFYSIKVPVLFIHTRAQGNTTKLNNYAYLCYYTCTQHCL